MNISITEGLDLMPPAFADGLDAWSSADGTPGSASYAGAANATLVAADADFGGCLDLLKTETVQKLRWMGETPIRPGVYLRVRTRVKAVSGVFPAVRIAAFAADEGGNALPALTQVGPSVALATYGEVVEIAAIIGTGARPGVDMAWGVAATSAHVGLDLIGGTGGHVRVDDFVVEDVTGAFLRDLMDAVDVRDYGALGDGIADDRAAFVAADAAAAGRTLMVPAGSYRIGASLTLQSKVRFEGTLEMDDAARLVLVRNFDLPSYVDAFGDEGLAFRKGFQALMHAADHEAFDLGGRRVDLAGPVDMQAAVADLVSFDAPRALRNGQFHALDTIEWEPQVMTAQGSYDPLDPTRITGLPLAGEIPVGALVTGAGVGREVYVSAVDGAAGTVTLSLPLHGAAPTQDYAFTRFRYALDFSGFEALSGFSLDTISFQLLGRGSGVLLPPGGDRFALSDCSIDRPADRGVTSPGRGCDGLELDRCRFISNEPDTPAVDRASVAVNVNGDRAKIRNCRIDRFGLGAMLHGAGHLVIGNHIDQADAVEGGALVPGIVLTSAPAGAIVTGNAIDNCYLEWTNEHDAAPGFAGQGSFSGLSVTGNSFAADAPLSSFHFIEVKPYGSGHFLSHVTVAGNLFRVDGGAIARVEGVDNTHAGLDAAAFENLSFDANAFAGVDDATRSPATLPLVQNTAEATWTLDAGATLPFGGHARSVVAVVAEGGIVDAAGQPVAAMPFTVANAGPDKTAVQLVWPVACKGAVNLTVRVDRPV